MSSSGGTGELRRHIFTSAAGGPHGAGFQTVASAITDLDLQFEIEQALEEASEAAATEGLHQALTLPGRPELFLFSRLEPAGAAADARRGNFWAESIVTPRSWLEGAGWDVARAIERIDFPGPRPLPGAVESGAAASLDAEPLAALDAGPLARLERFRRLAAAQRRSVIEAVVCQHRDLTPIFIVRPEAMAPADFEQIVLLAPLLLPPGRRTGGGGARPMHLRTLGLAAGNAFNRSIDVLGVTAEQLEDVRREPGIVVDLNPERPSRRRRAAGAYGGAYVDWLGAVLADRRWDELKDYYESVAGREGDPVADFADSGKETSAPPAAGTPAAAKPDAGAPDASAVERQRRRWRARERDEDEAAALRREIAGDVRQLKAALQSDFARQRAALEQAGDGHLRQLEAVTRHRTQNLESGAARGGFSARRRRWAEPVRSGAWINPLLVAVMIVLAALLAADLWLGWPGRSRPEPPSPAPSGTPPAEETSFDVTRPDRPTALSLLQAALLSGRQEPSAIWLAWSSASIGDPAACALLQTALGSTVDSHCGRGTAGTLAAKIRELGLDASQRPEARFFEHLLGLESGCLSRPLTLGCLPPIAATRDFAGIANDTLKALEARIASRRRQGKTTAREAQIQSELSHLVLNVSSQLADRLREVPDFLVAPMLELAGETCPGAVADSRDRFDGAALARCLKELEAESAAAP